MGTTRDEGGAAPRVTGQQMQADDAAHGSSPDCGLANAESVQHGEHVWHLPADPVAVCIVRCVTAAMATGIDQNQQVLRGKRIDIAS